MHNKYKLFVISHTHWDREWYQTFQVFRKRLVYLIDELIDHMEKDNDYKYFHMDGQTIMLEDYLQIRPENKERLEKLIRQGRIIIGPWYVMPDEFLVSGESLIRNLKKGFDTSSEYGVEPMKNGYLVDIFGHNGQMPQILKGFGIDSAALFRGIGDYPKDAFRWVGADGSEVFCLKFDKERSYSNFYFAIRWPFEGRDYEKDELITRMEELLNYSKGLAVSNNLLMMDGVDHMEIEPRLPEVLSILNENMEGVKLVQSTIEEYVKALKESNAEFEEIKGELYRLGKDGINNSILRNVLSSMIHLKQMNNECEILLTRWVEPFDVAAGYIKPQNNKRFIEEAWNNLLKNHPHDSICGCSITQVHKDMIYRFDQVKEISEEMIRHEFNEIVSSINTKSLDKPFSIVLFNGSQKDFEGVVEVELEFPVDSQDNFKIFDCAGNEVPYQVLSVRKGCLKEEYGVRKLIGFFQKDYYRVAFNAYIPSVGYNAYGYEEYKNIWPPRGDYTYKVFHKPVRYLGNMQVAYRTWENEYLKVTVELNGSLCVINRKTGKVYRDILAFEDAGDIGDAWRYIKPIKDSKISSIEGKVDFSVEHDGLYITRWKIIHHMNIPLKMEESGRERSTEIGELKIVTFIEMKKGSSKLEFTTFINNELCEHRVRALFPCNINADRFFTSTPFCLQERGVEKLDWSDYNETETGVVPNQGIAVIKDEKDCLAIYNRGLYELEVMEDESRTIALTLFRSFKKEVFRDVGEISFMKMEMKFEYALDFRDGNVNLEELMIDGEAYRTGIKAVCTGSHEGLLRLSNSFLSVNIPGAVLSALKRGNGGMTIVRIYNCTKKETSGSIAFFKPLSRAFLLNLNEEVTGDMVYKENMIYVQMKPWKIMTMGVLYSE